MLSRGCLPRHVSLSFKQQHGSSGCARCYLTIQHMQRHLAQLEALADNTKLAKDRSRFVRSSKIVCTIGPKVANGQDLDMLMGARRVRLVLRFL